jgi:membrane protein implicated in regulation of membrane protease activity
MLYVYLGALIIGAGTIFLQIILAGHGDADAHLDHDASHDGESHDTEAWSVFLSARFWTFLLLAFGLVGALITFFGFAGPVVTGIVAAVAGLAAGTFAALALRALRRSQASSSTTLVDAIGTVGRVLIPCAKGKVGKVRLQLKGQAVDVMAMTNEAEIPVGASVVVDDVKGGMAQVSKAPKELAS